MGFWNSLLRSSPVNNAAGNNIAFPGVRSSREAVNDHEYSIDNEYSEEFASEVYDNEYSEEFASELKKDINITTTGFDSYSKNGVFVKETTDIFRLTYDGILARDGAQDVYAVVGFDDNKNWHDVKYYPMSKTDGQTFELLLPIAGSKNFNVAFKDGANHWDNNSGLNYTYVNEGG